MSRLLFNYYNYIGEKIFVPTPRLHFGVFGAGTGGSRLPGFMCNLEIETRIWAEARISGYVLNCIFFIHR